MFVSVFDILFAFLFRSVILIPLIPHCVSGLGTGMGLGNMCPKSLIRVREEMTFLDVTVAQIEVNTKHLDLPVHCCAVNFCIYLKHFFTMDETFSCHVSMLLSNFYLCILFRTLSLQMSRLLKVLVLNTTTKTD